MTAWKTNEHNFSNHVYHKLNPNSLVLKDLGYISFEDFKNNKLKAIKDYS